MDWFFNPSVIAMVVVVGPGVAWVAVCKIRADRDVKLDRGKTLRAQLEWEREMKRRVDERRPKA